MKGKGMRKILLSLAIASLAISAEASKSRVTALGGDLAVHLVDPQTAFVNPAHLNELPDYATYEFGSTLSYASSAGGSLNQLTSPKSEGGFVKTFGDAKFGFYLGRTSEFTNTMRSLYGFLNQENPIELQYSSKAGLNWGAALNYSSSDKKTGGKQQAMGVRFGITDDAWSVGASVGLGSTATGTLQTRPALNSTSTGSAGAAYSGLNAANPDFADFANFNVLQDADAKYTGTAGYSVIGKYLMSDYQIYARVEQDGHKYESTVNTTLNNTENSFSRNTLGFVKTEKLESATAFWGAAYRMSTLTSKIGSTDTKWERTSLPLIVGGEVDAAQWLKVRASVSQNVLLSTYKKSVTGTAADSVTKNNDTTLAAGAGINFTKWTLDGTVTSQTTGNINQSEFLTNASLTYNF